MVLKKQDKLYCPGMHIWVVKLFFFKPKEVISVKVRIMATYLGRKRL